MSVCSLPSGSKLSRCLLYPLVLVSSPLKHSLPLTLFSISGSSPWRLCWDYWTCLPVSPIHYSSFHSRLQPASARLTPTSMKLFRAVHLSSASHIWSLLKSIQSASFVFLLPIQTFSVTYSFYLLYHSCFIELGLLCSLRCCPIKSSLSAALNFTCWIILTPIAVPQLTCLFLHYPAINAVA